jgi:hypothetical protein
MPACSSLVEDVQPLPAGAPDAGPSPDFQAGLGSITVRSATVVIRVYR